MASPSPSAPVGGRARARLADDRERPARRARSARRSRPSRCWRTAGRRRRRRRPRPARGRAPSATGTSSRRSGRTASSTAARASSMESMDAHGTRAMPSRSAGMNSPVRDGRPRRPLPRPAGRRCSRARPAPRRSPRPGWSSSSPPRRSSRGRRPARSRASREAPPLCRRGRRARWRPTPRSTTSSPAGTSRRWPRACGELAGARDAAGALAALEALRRAVWSAALVEAPRAPAALVADLADRLSAVVRDAHRRRAHARAAAPPAAAPPPPRAAEPAARARAGAGRRAGRRRRAARRARPRRGRGEPAARPGPARARERASGRARGRAAARRARRTATGRRPSRLRGWPRATPARTWPRRATEFIDEGRPFAVLLVELDGIDDLLEADDGGRGRGRGRRARARGPRRPGDAIRRERPGRFWLTLPGAGPAGARALALRAAACVERAAGHRGRPLAASVGVAVCPRDGADADALAEPRRTRSSRPGPRDRAARRPPRSDFSQDRALAPRLLPARGAGDRGARSAACAWRRRPRAARRRCARSS